MVSSKYEQDKSLGKWVSTQRQCHAKNKMRPDRKIILNEIGFAWKDDGAYTLNQDDKRWHQHYEKLVELKRINGNCKVPQTKNNHDKSLARWVRNQRSFHKNNKLLRDRQELLDKLDFIWKADTVATRSYTTNVRGLAI
jgi:hypothetical protein